MIAVPKPVRVKDPQFLLWLRKQDCVFWGSLQPSCGGFLNPVTRKYASEACHVRSRGAGGDDPGNVVPMCSHHHQEQHRIGIKSFEKRHHVDLKAIAGKYWRRYQRETQGVA